MVVTVVTVFAAGSWVCLTVTVVPASGVAVMKTVEGGVEGWMIVTGGLVLVTGTTIEVDGVEAATTTVTSLDMAGLMLDG